MFLDASFLKQSSTVSDSATSWPILSMEFSRSECWSGWPIPSPADLPNPGIEPGSPALQADSLPTELSGKPVLKLKVRSKCLVGSNKIILVYKKKFIADVCVS